MNFNLKSQKASSQEKRVKLQALNKHVLQGQILIPSQKADSQKQGFKT